jgi:hypothetical protein
VHISERHECAHEQSVAGLPDTPYID